MSSPPSAFSDDVSLWRSALRCITGEYEVAIFGGQVAGVAGLVQRLVARFAVREVAESPAAGGGVLFRVLNHELNIHSGPGNKRLQARARKADRYDFVVFLRRDFIPMQRGNDGAVGERELPCPKGLYRNIVAQLGAHLFQVASCSRQVVDRDQAPVTISARDLDSVDRRGVSVDLSGGWGQVGG